VAARSGEALLERVASAFGTTIEGSADEVPYAATGLAAAWLHQPFAGFPTVTVFTRRRPPRDPLDAHDLEFARQERTLREAGPTIAARGMAGA
jgi:hypothetical protein